MMNDFGKRLAEIRKLKKLNQSELGILIGFSRYTVSNWESGKSSPSLGEIMALSKALNISADFFTSSEPVVSNNINNSTISGSTITQTINNSHDYVASNPTGNLHGGSTTVTAPAQNVSQGSVSFISRSDIRMIPVINTAGEIMPDGQLFPLPKNEIPLLGNVDTDSLFALQITDDMMSPYLAAGDFAVCSKTNDVSPGQLVVSTLYGSCIVRGIRLGETGDISLLVVGNRTYTDTPITAANRTQLHVIGKVLCIYHPSTAPGILL